jgi:tol-pal system protein YbgF
LALGLVVVAVPSPGWSQDRSTEERLDRVERDLNMLLRQVYRGALPPAAASADGGGGEAVNTEIRMERVEEQIRDLTGRVEELMNQVNQVRQRVEQINSDVELRFSQSSSGQLPSGQLPGAAAAASPAMPSAPPPPRRAELAFPPGPGGDDFQAPDPEAPDQPLAARPHRPPPPELGTLTPPGTPSVTPSGTPSAPTELTSAGSTPPHHERAGELPAGSAASQYNYAFGLLKKADYPAAETALRQFIERHPRDALAGSAQFWLGETYYARRRYMEAATAFAEGYKRYPKSTKAADNLLKLGMSLARADQKQNACVALGQLDRDFPTASASVRQRAAAEKRRLGC